MICPQCGQLIPPNQATSACPACSYRIAPVHGGVDETDLAGEKTLLLNNPSADISEERTLLNAPLMPETVRPPARPAPAAPNTEAETIITGKAQTHSATTRPTGPEDSYVPFTGNSGIMKMIKEPGSAPPQRVDPTATKSDFGDERTVQLNPGQQQPPAHQTPPGAKTPRGQIQSNAPIPTIRERQSNAPRYADAESPTEATPSSQKQKDESLAFDHLGPEGINGLIGKGVAGYVIRKKLGQGGMGAVCLARQVSLDRDVALKILPSNFASDPDFVARFTREALSAAQLNHHNVVQVFDVGSDKGIHFIAMEFVKGDNLGSMTRRDGKLSIEDATGYVLQAARGLKYAHERGIIHRDIKPDNLMVNEHGVVKIADMGLAKIQGSVERSYGLDTQDIEELKNQAYSELTAVNVAMGTPAYMAPEQGRDASKVDHRADQYSLGCTLYYLIAGKAPFTGKTTFEVISKHMSEPVVPIDTLVKNVPRELSYIIEKMLSKEPLQRYPSLREAVEALEAYLGIDNAKGPYTPREHHVAILEKEQKAYYLAPALKLRRLAVMGFFTLFGLLTAASLVAGAFAWAGAFVGILVLTPLINFIVNGIITKAFLFRRVRSVFFGMGLKQWGIAIGSALGGLLVLFLLGWLVPWIVMSVISAGLVAGYQLGIAKKLRAQRVPHLAAVQDMLKQLRVRGVGEDAIQDFVTRFSGAQTGGHWEEFFEELFGYEDMINNRLRIAARDKAHVRKKFATWRDPIARWLDEVEEKRKKAHEQAQLAKAEKARLKATGMDEAAATQEADKLAQEAVDEGLLKKTAIIDSPTKADIARIDRELHASGKKRPGLFLWGYRLVRLAAGLVVLGVGGSVVAGQFGVSLPTFVDGLISSGTGLKSEHRYFLQYGLPVLVLGVLALISVLSQRWILPALVTVGSLVAVFFLPFSALVQPAQPMLTPMIAYLGGVTCALIGFVGLILARLGGKKF